VGVEVRPGPASRGEDEYPDPGGPPDRRCLLFGPGDSGRILGLFIRFQGQLHILRWGERHLTWWLVIDESLNEDTKGSEEVERDQKVAVEMRFDELRMRNHQSTCD